MGSSKRYAHRYDRLMDERTLQRIAADSPLQTLSPKELQSEALPVTRDPAAQGVQGVGAIRTARRAGRCRGRRLERPRLRHPVPGRWRGDALLGVVERRHPGCVNGRRASPPYPEGRRIG